MSRNAGGEYAEYQQFMMSFLHRFCIDLGIKKNQLCIEKDYRMNNNMNQPSQLYTYECVFIYFFKVNLVDYIGMY